MGGLESLLEDADHEMCMEDRVGQVDAWGTFQVSLSGGSYTHATEARPCTPLHGVEMAPPDDAGAHATETTPCTPLHGGLGGFLHATVETLCAEMRKSLSPILPRPANRAPANQNRNPRKKRRLDITPRQSARIAKHTATKQQQVLIRKLCLAHEGEIISDEALQMYVDLFSRPLSDAHIAAVLALFG